MMISINKKEYNPEHFVERCTIKSSLKACEDALEGKLESYWKYWRDAICLLRLLESKCFECDKKAIYVHRLSPEGDYFCLRCQDHAPPQIDENWEIIIGERYE